MIDLAALGFAVDTSQLDAATKSLENVAQSGKSAQISADVLVASAVRLGISVEEVQRRLAAANDNLAKHADLSMKLADATKQASAANDNFSGSMKASNAATAEAGRGFFGTIEHVLNLTGHLKLLAVAAYALSPPFRGIVNSGVQKFFMDVLPITGLTTAAMNALSASMNTLLTVFMRVGPPIATAVVAFQLFNAIWTKGAELLDKYANSLRSLYSEDTVANLQKLTKNQGEAGEIITAEQIARATELGVRLQDASFIIQKFLNTSIIDTTNVSLKFQAVWVNIVELIARAAQLASTIPVGKLAEAAARNIAAPVVAGVKLAADILAPDTSRQDSLIAAKDRLSAVMGVANLTKESTDRLKNSVGELDKEFDIGNSFIARFSDNIKKLAEGAGNLTDTWDRVAKAIERHTAVTNANASSVGETIKFQEQLRVETQLLTSTKGGLNAVTDEQLDKFTELRTKGIEPLTAIMEAGIRLDKGRAQSLKEMGEAAGQARQEFAKAQFEITNQRAIDADVISRRALTAFSPSAKGEIADAQKRLELQQELNKGIATQEQVDERAASARKLAIQGEIVQLSEAARARELASKQSLDSAKLEVDLVGKSIGQQTELRANLQARQQLEQEASQKRTAFDEAQFERLKKINAELGKQAQINALNAVNDNIRFDRQTALLSPEDVAIANQLRTIYPDVAEGLKSVQAAGIQTNRALSSLSGTISTTLTSGLADILDGTKSVSQGFQDMSKSIIRAIEEMIIKLYIVTPLMRALQSSLSGFGFGGSEVGVGPTGPVLPSAHGNVFGGAGIGAYSNQIIDRPTIFPFAKGIGLMGEAGSEAVMPLSRGRDGRLGVQSGGGAPNITVNLIEDSSRGGETESQQRNDGGFDLTVYVDAITAKNATNPGSATSSALDSRKRVAKR